MAHPPHQGFTMILTQATFVTPPFWGSPKASHIKASPHFPRFRVCIFRIFLVFARWGLLRPLFLWGERGLPHFPHFPRIGFESLISKIRPTGSIMTGLNPRLFWDYFQEIVQNSLFSLFLTKIVNFSFFWSYFSWRKAKIKNQLKLTTSLF